VRLALVSMSLGDKMKLKRGDVIRINWVDAGGTGGWKVVNEFKPPKISSVGQYIKTDKSGVYFAEGIDKNDEEQVLKLSFIPHGCIQRLRRLVKYGDE